jgi:SCA7, zinc-binding domain
MTFSKALDRLPSRAFEAQKPSIDLKILKRSHPDNELLRSHFGATKAVSLAHKGEGLPWSKGSALSRPGKLGTRRSIVGPGGAGPGALPNASNLPSSGDAILLGYLAPNRPGIAQLAGEILLNSDSEADEEAEKGKKTDEQYTAETEARGAERERNRARMEELMRQTLELKAKIKKEEDMKRRELQKKKEEEKKKREEEDERRRVETPIHPNSFNNPNSGWEGASNKGWPSNEAENPVLQAAGTRLEEDQFDGQSGVPPNGRDPGPKRKVSKPKGPIDVERQCGVTLPNGAQCARSLTCNSHSMGAKRAVPGRSLPYDILLHAYQKKNQVRGRSEFIFPFF